MKVLVHLAGAEVGVTRNPEVLGIQGKRRTVTRKVPRGTIPGGRVDLAYPSYSYEGVEPGFAEHDLDEYNKIATRLSWARSLDTVRKGFKVEVDLERVWEEHTERESRDFYVASVMSEFADHADSGICNKRRAKDDVHHGHESICQPCPHPDRWNRQKGSPSLLRRILHTKQSAIDQDEADFTDDRIGQDCGRDLLCVQAHAGGPVDAAGYPTHE